MHYGLALCSKQVIPYFDSIVINHRFVIHVFGFCFALFVTVCLIGFTLLVFGLRYFIVLLYLCFGPFIKYIYFL